MSSTEIPKAILKISIVEGLIGIPMYPINPAVISNGSKFGIREIMIILKFLKRYAINRDINIIASPKEATRLSTKK